MHGLVVIEGMTLSGHPWIINEMTQKCKWMGLIVYNACKVNRLLTITYKHIFEQAFYSLICFL